MTKEEYDNYIKRFNEELRIKKEMLNHRFVNENNPVKLGDIIRDHIGCGKVLDLNYSYQYGTKYPCAIYKCIEFTLKGVPKKNQAIRTIYQCNLIAINGEEYKYKIE